MGFLWFYLSGDLQQIALAFRKVLTAIHLTVARNESYSYIYIVQVEETTFFDSAIIALAVSMPMKMKKSFFYGENFNISVFAIVSSRLRLVIGEQGL